MIEIKDAASFAPYRVNSGEYPTPEVLNRSALGMINNDMILEAATEMLARSGGAQLVTSKTKLLCHFNGNTKDVIGSVTSDEEAAGQTVYGLASDGKFDGAYTAQDSSFNLVSDNAGIDSSFNTLSGWTVSGTKVGDVSVLTGLSGLTLDNDALRTAYPLHSDVFAPGTIILTSEKYSIVGQEATSASVQVSTLSNMVANGVTLEFKINFYTDTTFISAVNTSLSSNKFDGALKLENIPTPPTATKAECAITVTYSNLQSSNFPSTASINIKNLMHCVGIICHTYAASSSDATSLTYSNVVNGASDFSVFSWVYFNGNQINNYNLNYGPLFINGVPTTGARSYHVTSAAVVGDTVSIGDVVFTCVASSAVSLEFNAGADAAAAAVNLKTSLDNAVEITSTYDVTIEGTTITLTEKTSGGKDTPAEAVCTGTIAITSSVASISSPNNVGIRHFVTDKGSGKFTVAESTSVYGTKLTIPEADYNKYLPVMLRRKTVNNLAIVDILVLCSDGTLLKANLGNITLNSSYYSIIVGKDPNETITPSYFNGGITELRYDEEWLNDAQFTMMALNEQPFNTGYESVDLAWYKPNANLIKNPEGKLGLNFWEDAPTNFDAIVEDVDIGSGFKWFDTSAATSDVKSAPVTASAGTPFTLSSTITASADATGQVGIKLSFYSDLAGTTYIGCASAQAGVGSTSDCVVKAVTPSEVRSVRAIMYIASATATSVKWSKLKLEKGSTSTKFTDDYTPAYAVYAE